MKNGLKDGLQVRLCLTNEEVYSLWVTKGGGIVLRSFTIHVNFLCFLQSILSPFFSMAMSFTTIDVIPVNKNSAVNHAAAAVGIPAEIDGVLDETLQELLGLLGG